MDGIGDCFDEDEEEDAVVAIMDGMAVLSFMILTLGVLVFMGV